MFLTANDVIDWRCPNCHGGNLHIMFPVWFCAQTNTFIEHDTDAEPLSVFYNTCQTQVVAVDDDGATLTGRWD